MSLFTLLAGCGPAGTADYESIGLVEVRGTVSFDGAPLADAIVEFESPDKTFSSGRTDRDGRYVLKFNSEQSGATPGAKVIRIRTTGAPSDEVFVPDELAQTRPLPRERIPPCYNKDSRLRVVLVGHSQRVDFELFSSGRPRGEN